MFQRVMFGELSNPKNQKLADLNAREIVIMIPLLIMIFVMGVYPTPFLDKMSPAIDRVILLSKTKKVAMIDTVAPVEAQTAPVVLPEGMNK